MVDEAGAASSAVVDPRPGFLRLPIADDRAIRPLIRLNLTGRFVEYPEAPSAAQSDALLPGEASARSGAESPESPRDEARARLERPSALGTRASVSCYVRVSSAGT